MFSVEFSSKTKSFLKKVDKTIFNRIIAKIESLRDNPFLSDVKRVVGENEKTFRVRVGDYRIQYSVIHDGNTLLISRIDKRERAYK